MANIGLYRVAAGLGRTIVVSGGGSTRTPKTLTLSGNGELDTAIKKFGTASLYNDGSGDLDITVESTDFNFGTGDFTVEAQVYIDGDATSPANPIVVTNRSPNHSDETWFLGYYEPSTEWNFSFQTTDDGRVGGSGSSSSLTGVTYSTGQWYHIALVRDGTTIRFYVDGTEEVTITGFDGSLGDNSNSNFASNQSKTAHFLTIGSLTGNTNTYGYHHIDELRISDTARYTTSSFTVPSSAFTNDDDTLLLLHFDGADGSTTITDDGGS